MNNSKSTAKVVIGVLMLLLAIVRIYLSTQRTPSVPVESYINNEFLQSYQNSDAYKQFQDSLRQQILTESINDSIH